MWSADVPRFQRRRGTLTDVEGETMGSGGRGEQPASIMQAARPSRNSATMA